MKNKSEIEIAPAREYLHALLYYPDYIKLINPKNKPYQKVHEWFLKTHEFMSDDNSRFPTIKEVATELSMDQTKFKNQMIKLYDDIIELNHEKPHLFVSANQTLCDLYFKGFRGYGSFRIGLNAIPRIKDSFSFRFIEPKTQQHYFHVTRVTHEIHTDRHEICIWLDVREPNMYLELLKEKAHFRGDVSIMELSGYPNPYEIEEKLRNMYNSL